LAALVPFPAPPVSHDHYFLCRVCEMVLYDLRDCPCDMPDVTHTGFCANCQEGKEYERTEAARNIDY
jgi:hypothetical protein